MFDWIDVDTKECLAVWISEGRIWLSIYPRSMFKYCENKPEIVVNKAPWYL